MDVTLYTRKNCPLCDEAKKTLLAARVAPREVDVDLDPELKRRFSNDVPVIFIGGEEAFRHRIEWRVVDGHLEREFKFKDFAEALAFTSKIGAIAEKHNHHPDILLSWGKVKVTTWSHDANGITVRDLRLAGAIDGIQAPSP